MFVNISAQHLHISVQLSPFLQQLHRVFCATFFATTCLTSILDKFDDIFWCWKIKISYWYAFPINNFPAKHLLIRKILFTFQRYQSTSCWWKVFFMQLVVGNLLTSLNVFCLYKAQTNRSSGLMHRSSGRISSLPRVAKASRILLSNDKNNLKHLSFVVEANFPLVSAPVNA